MATAKLNKYEIDLRPIGRGYNSYVFKGFDTITHKKVAIKKMKNIEFGKYEADIMTKYGSHKSLPQFYDFFIFENCAYNVMELIEGNRLGKNPARIPVHPENKAVQITIDILEGLNHLHNKGFLHTDIHPHNILISKTQVIKIIDFEGMVQKDSNGIYTGYRTGGMRGYIPPELAHNPIVIDNSTDIYATACICVYLIIGEAPFNVNNSCKKINNIHLRKFLLKALHPDKKKRYHSARDFINDLNFFV